ncbi:hypothetical protein Taro_037276 [Colocasia esculenta]|uniref:Uncharacterized protein n=1 Tax=Colocasia esculenta TaxID=4460 RepID=A0A843WAP6_COLES|nr:hypothetical protein [Colocasia esculenta]
MEWGLLTSGMGRRRLILSRSGRDGEVRRDPNHCAVFKQAGRTELSQALLDQGRSCCGRFGVLVWCSMRSRREDVARSGGNAAPCVDCVFFVKAGRTELSQALLDQGRSCCGRFGVLVWCSTRSRREDITRSGGNTAPCVDCMFFVKDWEKKSCGHDWQLPELRWVELEVLWKRMVVRKGLELQGMKTQGRQEQLLTLLHPAAQPRRSLALMAQQTSAQEVQPLLLTAGLLLSPRLALIPLVAQLTSPEGG